MSVADDLISYYQALLIFQYAALPNAQGTVGAAVSQLVANAIISQVRDAFNLPTAVGAQLDILGEFRGAQRQYFDINLTRTYFTMPFYGAADPLLGFAIYGGIGTVTWYFETYNDSGGGGGGAQFTLTDAEMRLLIQYLADLHNSDFGLGDLDDLLFKYFGNNVTLTDNLDMTILYTHNPADLSNFFKIVNDTHNLPHPAGVAVGVV